MHLDVGLIYQISTPTYPCTSMKHGKGQAEYGGQSPHMKIMSNNMRCGKSGSWEPPLDIPYGTPIGQVAIPIPRSMVSERSPERVISAGRALGHKFNRCPFPCGCTIYAT